MKLRATYALWILCFALPCGAQNKGVVSRRAMEALVDPRPIEQSVLVFEPTEITLPDLSEDDRPVSVSFYYANRGTEPIVITRVAASCGCIAAEYDKAPVLAKGEGVIRVTFSPKGHPGKLMRNVFVYTNLSSQSPSARLFLTGHVTPTSDKWAAYPHRLGELRIRQPTAAFRNIARSGKTVECIACVNGGGDTLHLRAVAGVLPPYLTFGTEPEAIAPGETADLVLTLDADFIPEDMPETVEIPVIIEGLDKTAVERAIHISISRQPTNKLNNK